MDGPKQPSHDSSVSLIARLDHLEFIMKYLERKQRYGTNVPAYKGKQSLDSSTKEDFYKGTLLDRVASLELRLLKLYVEMDSSDNSLPLSHDSTQTSGESSSCHGSKREICYSFPTFNNIANNGEKGLAPIKTSEISQIKETNHELRELRELLEKSESEKQEIKNSCPPMQQGKNKAKKNEKKWKVEKKTLSPVSWPHLKLLGC